MPHQCVRCNTFYSDAAPELLKGCSCGGRLFFFIRKEQMEKAKQIEQVQLTKKDKEQIEKDVRELVGVEEDDKQPVILDLEAIRVREPGKYELDLVHLFKGEPIVFKLEDGKYMIDIAQSFRRKK